MKKSVMSMAIMAAMVSSASFAVDGGTSNPNGVDVGSANHFMFGGGNSGLKLNDSSFGYINIHNGPIKGAKTAIDARGNGTILTPADMGLIGSTKIAQVWRTTAATNGTGEYANFAITNVRQIDPPFFAPQFGGLVIGQVAANTTGTPAGLTNIDPLILGSGVYFGEWAPAVSNPADDSYNLNMTSADRTVWYVGDNATTATTMPSTIEAKYGVIGISMTGSDASGNTLAGGLPGNQNYYTGKLDVSYDASRPQTQNIITGTIGRGGYDINFGKAGDATTITNTGSFGNSSGTIDGQFYNGAEALAGIYTGSDTPNSVAFGGSKIANNP